LGGFSKSRGYLPLIIIVIIFIPLLYGCAKKGQPQRKPAGKGGGQEIKIAVSLVDMERDGNKIIKNTIEGRTGQGDRGGQGDQGGEQGGQQGQQAQGGGQRVNITWLDAKNDPARQAKDLEQLAGQNVRAVILQVVDPSSGPGLVRKLAQANIKVIALDALPANSPLDGYIAFDHTRAGELQARYLLSAARERSVPLKVVVFQGDRDDQASREVAASVLENLKNQSRAQVVLVKDHPRGDPQMAVATLDQVLASTNNQIDAVVATDSRITAAVAKVLKNRGLDQRVITLGVGADQQASRALEAGEHDAEVDIMPEMVAQYAFDAAVGLATTGHWQYEKQLRNGDFDVPAKVTPVRLLTRSEAYLLEQRWGKPAGREGQQGGQQGQPGGQKQGGGDGGKEGEGDQGGGGKKTTLRITTQDGKTVEMQINGEIKKIETLEGAAGGQGGGGS